MLKINQIYKVKEGHEGKCRAYKNYKGSFIQIIDIFSNTCITYYILNKYKKVVYNYCSCFTEDDLEEEVKQKSLEDLEVGDEVNDDDDRIYKIIKVSKAYQIINNKEKVSMWKSIEELENQGYQYSKLQSLSPSEAETLLEEKLGIKVKIKN